MLIINANYHAVNMGGMGVGRFIGITAEQRETVLAFHETFQLAETHRWPSYPLGGNGSLPYEERSRIRPSLRWMNNSLR